jgi:hypothetical protein
MLKNVIAA